MPLECFYTLSDSSFHRIIWRIEPQLRNHIYLLRQKIDPLAEFNEKTLEAIIARELFEKLQQHPEQELIRTHWIAFLERRCEQVASKILSFFPAPERPAYFQDLFLMGCEVVSDSRKFFDKFDNRRSRIDYWYPTLKRFSDVKIKHLLMPKVRQMTGRETLGRSNLGLVARSSRTQVREALQHSGYKEAKLSQYLLIWQCFQEARNSLELGANRFRPEHFQKIAERYREFRSEFTLPEAENQDLNGKQIEALLEDIGIAIRQLLDPPLDSLDTPLYSQSDEENYLIQNIHDEPKSNEEINQTVAALIEFIDRVVEGLKGDAEKPILFLRYGLELKQSQVGKELGGQPQYQVSRHLQKLNNRILSQIWDWVRQHLEIEPNSEGLNEIEAVLCQYYSNQIDRFFKSSIQFLGRQSRELLRLFYIVKLNTLEIAKEIHKSESEVKNLLEAIRQWLYSSITEQIQTEIQFLFQSQSTAKERIHAITETRLQTILQLYIQ